MHTTKSLQEEKVLNLQEKSNIRKEPSRKLVPRAASFPAAASPRGHLPLSEPRWWSHSASFLPCRPPHPGREAGPASRRRGAWAAQAALSYCRRTPSGIGIYPEDYQREGQPPGPCDSSCHFHAGNRGWVPSAAGLMVSTRPRWDTFLGHRQGAWDTCPLC